VKNPNRKKTTELLTNPLLSRDYREKKKTSQLLVTIALTASINPNYCAYLFIEQTRVINCGIPKLHLTHGLSFLYREASRLDRVRSASLRLRDVPLLCRSECSSQDSEWSSEHLNMSPLKLQARPHSLVVSLPGELTRCSSPRDTLLEVSPLSHRGWTSRSPNSYCTWASQFFQRSTSPMVVFCQGRQLGSTTPTISHLETESTQQQHPIFLSFSACSWLIVTLSNSNRKLK